MSLRYRVVGGVLAGLAIMFSIFSYLAVLTIDQSTNVALQERLRLAESIAKSVDQLAVHTGRQLAMVARLAELGSNIPERDQVKFVQGLLGEFKSIGRFDVDGGPIWAVPDWGVSVRFVASNPQVLVAAREKGVTTSQPMASIDGHSWVMVAVAAMNDSGGRLSGYMSGEVHPAHAGVELIPMPGPDQSTVVEMVDGRGEVIASSQSETGPAGRHVEVIGRFVADRKPGIALHSVGQGRDHVVAYYPLDAFPGGVVVEQQIDEALAVPRAMRRTLVLYGIVALVLAAGAAWLHAHTTMKPVRQLTRAASRMASGDLETPIISAREDEIGVLAGSFEEMRTKLKDSLEERDRWAEQLEDRVRERTQEVRDRVRELDALNKIRRQLLAKTIAAQEEERKRVARDLHDDSVQMLIALLMTLKTVEDALFSSPAEARQALERAQSHVNSALRQLRRAIADLRPSALDDLGLASAIRSYADERLRASDTNVSVTITGDDRKIADEMATAIFRIVQEAINNIAKHSQAGNAKIALDFQDSEVSVLVEDDGRGFDPEAVTLPLAAGQGLGLLGMRERAELFVGTVEIDSSPGHGTRIRVNMNHGQ